MELLITGLAIITFWLLLLLFFNKLNLNKELALKEAYDSKLVDSQFNFSLKSVLFYVGLSSLLFSLLYYEYNKSNYLEANEAFRSFCLSLACLLMGQLILIRRNK